MILMSTIVEGEKNKKSKTKQKGYFSYLDREACTQDARYPLASRYYYYYDYYFLTLEKYISFYSLLFF